MKQLIKHVFVLLSALIIVGVSGVLLQKEKISGVEAQVGSNKISGYAWSDTIGWVSFSDPKSTVMIATDGTLSGYAWSDNIGWVSFNSADLANCPSGTCTPKVNTSAGTVSGWARATAGCQDSIWNGTNCTGAGAGNLNGIYSGAGTPPLNTNWDGWINLNQVTYNSSNESFTGYGWGSDVVGWLAFNAGASGVSCDPTLQVCASTNSPTCTLNAPAASVPSGSTANLNWNSSNATSCALKDGSGNTLSTLLTSPGFTTANLTAASTFNLYCSNAAVPTPTLCSAATISITSSTFTSPGSGGSEGLWLKNNVFTTSITARPNSAIPVNWDVSTAMSDGYSCTENADHAAGLWTAGTPITFATSPNNSPKVTLRNLATGIYNIWIDCTKSALSTSTNRATITILPSSINEN
jgi:hypothetical protein